MNQPLASLKILDFTTLLPGPFATMMLADMGADVLRIEAPHRTDMVRQMPPFDGETAAWHGVLNRSKRSLVLNLKSSLAKEIVLRLITTGGYDILIEQFRPGVMARLGLDYDTLQAHNPALIYCAITGYGQEGPLRDRAGHDINYLSLAGVMSHSGRAEGGPAALGVQVADVGGGSLGALVGLLAAVIQRQVSGAGQMVDISMLDMMIAWQAHIVSQYLIADELPQRESLPLNGGGGNYDFYRTEDGRYLSVGSLEPKFWHELCQAVERPDLKQMAYAEDATIQQTLKKELREVFGQRPLHAWLALFENLDACVEPVQTIAEMVNHPHTVARQMIVDVPKGNGRSQRQVGSPIKFSASRPTYKHVGAKLGAHTHEVLQEIGYNDKEIDNLEANDALG